MKRASLPRGALCLSALLALLARLCAADASDIVIGGDRSAGVIVVPDDQWMEPAAWESRPRKGISSWAPEEQNMTYGAARLLREYFAKITGRELAIVPETEWERQQYPAAVIVGPTRLAVQQFGARIRPENLARCGYVAKSIPGRLLICGVNPWATYCGCAAILEEYAGVEWFWPTELGEEVPQRPELSFTRLDVTFEPAIAFHSGTLGEWGPRVGERPGDLEVGHSLGPNIYHAGRETNPEWFPLLDGRRFIPPAGAAGSVFGWQPCMASPAALERAIAATRDHLRTHNSFTLGLNDAVWRGCECAYCQAADGDPIPEFRTVPYHYNGRYSRRYYQFLSRVAAAVAPDCPGKPVTTFAYSGTDIPPADAQPVPNLAVTLCSVKLAWLNPELRTWEELRHRRWARLTPFPGSYDYMYQTGYLPMYTPHLHAEVTRFLAANGYARAFAETYETMARSGPKYWVHIKLCLDPTRDVDALLDRWMRGMFKASAAPMAEFYRTIEQAWLDYPYHARNTDGWGTYCYSGGCDLPVLSPATLARLDECLAQAEAAAPDGKVRSRLAVIRKNYIPTRAFAEICWRARPYRDPVPFDDALAREDLAEHERQVPPFDFLGYYDRECANDPLSYIHSGKEPPPDAAAAKRLGRVVDAIVLQPLAAVTNAGTDAASVRAAIARRAADFAAGAGAKPETRALLDQLGGRVVPVRRIERAPELDGALDDPAWRGVEEQAGFYAALPPAASSGAVTAPAASAHDAAFRICHDGRTLYVAVTCRQPPASIVARATSPADSAVSEDDRVVVSVYPWQQRYTTGPLGAAVTVTAGGVVVEDGTGYGATYWHARSRAAVSTGADGYTVEVAIPFMAVLLAPQPGRLCQFNVRRFVGGGAPEASAWYPPEVGATFAWFEQPDPKRLLWEPGRPTTAPLGGAVASRLSPAEWQAYAVEAPGDVVWPGKGDRAALTGGRAVLLGNAVHEIQPAQPYDLEADYGGAGRCVPNLGWYARTDDGWLEAPEAARGGTAAEAPAEGGLRTARVRVTAPAMANGARLRIECSGAVQVAAMRLIPRLPLDIRLDLDTDADRLITGHVFGLQATVRNVSDRPIEALKVRLAFPAGVDPRCEAVTAASALQPGAATQALWWLTPVYAVGQADFTVVAEAKDLAPLTFRARGP